MPGISAALSPVVSNSQSNNASASETNGASDAGTNSPFSSVLQRFVKSQDGQSNQSKTPAANDAIGKTQSAETAVPSGVNAQDPALMANLVALLQSQQAANGKESATTTGDKKQDDKDKAKDDSLSAPTDNPLAGLALNQPVVTTGGQTPTGQEKSDDNGKQGLSLADKTAILASSETADEKSASKAGHDGGDGDFQALLDSAHAIQTQGQTNGTSATNQLVRQESRIETPVGHQNWSQEVGDKLTWMVGKQESKAELVLTPPQMGRIEVSITLNGDQASASFNTTNPAVRDALESALPRLKEILADAGVRLDQAQVGADTRQNSPQDQERRDNSGRNAQVATGDFVPGLNSVASGSSNVSQWIRQGNGMVDTFV
ncbi:MAG TPA: flagellar hook-length control protein FliK [Rhodocyclaceae bacterium]|jgi:flagellar hook-length control protein FliK|nr:flagellar hook-length control protein FliK [Rhodocyclaceae bacterium]